MRAGARQRPRLSSGESPGRLDAVDVRHSDVHEDNVGFDLAGQGDRCGTFGDLADDLVGARDTARTIVVPASAD